MFFTITIVILALSLGGLLFGLGIIPTILENIAHLLNTRFKATLAVATTALGVNFIVGEQYLSILLAGKTFRPIYDKLGLHQKNLSRALEDSGTVINPLVPWSVRGCLHFKHARCTNCSVRSILSILLQLYRANGSIRAIWQESKRRGKISKSKRGYRTKGLMTMCRPPKVRPKNLTIGRSVH